MLRQFVIDTREYSKLRELLLELVEYVNKEVIKIRGRYNCIIPHLLEIRH